MQTINFQVSDFSHTGMAKLRDMLEEQHPELKQLDYTPEWGSPVFTAIIKNEIKINYINEIKINYIEPPTKNRWWKRT